MASEQEVYTALIRAGFSRSQAAGIMGNIENESSFNPEAVGDQGTSFGLVQWHLPSYPFARGLVTGNPSRDMAAQITHIRDAAHGLNLSGSAGAVAGVWASQFERCVGCQPGGPQFNARVANANRIYQQAVSGKWPAPAGGGISGKGGKSGGAGGGAAQAATLTAFTSSLDGALSSVGALVHGTAVVLDRGFAMFAPGQGWRFVFWGITAGAAYGSWQAFTAEGEDGSGNLPLAIGLAGVAALSLFMAARPWPQTSTGVIKPGAYLVDIIEGQPPPPGPQPVSAGEVQLTEAGIYTLVGLWAAGKLAQVAQAGAGLLGGILGALGLGAAGAGTPVEPPPAEVPPVDVPPVL